MKKSTRRGLLVLTLIAGIVPALQGCFPVVATGVGMGAMMAADRRSSGSYVEDEGLEWKVQNRIAEKFGDRVHVNATSFNRNVLLSGEVPDDATRAEVDRIAASVPNVRAITNDLQVAGIASLTSRSNDVVITSKVKARFVDAATFGAHHVKVITEAGTVYLMGLVTREEADKATELARTTSGVRKVIRVFEYISPEEARRLDQREAEKK
ncbi:MAG: BON domain-containing protein [Rhodocyclaceae bacterium]|nr:BON domain-containing protein [Rhodocyclaceae bacterium]MCB1912768.1 BON domain-containing protein [Rhodocyclaceae bacterium]MCP5255739.1 BON domain-containing protein [Zoogloeaceae bacterium]MCW5615633.1 BON domain-containing protein [Rhodocyclaceae bacterium]